MLLVLKRHFSKTGQIFRKIDRNARTCLLVEPFWGVPFNLYTTYASLYMLALGCSEAQIGLLASVSLIIQMGLALIGGYITDRLGRRRTTLIFDLFSWTIPTLVWAFAQNFYYFLAAAVINSFVQIVRTSWSCLLIEETPAKLRVHVYAWIYVAGILAGFFAPLAGFIVGRFSLIPATRGLFFFAFLSMTTMFLLRNYFTHEPKMGVVKSREARGLRLSDTLKEYRRIILRLVKTPFILAAFFLAALNNICITIKRTFLSILLVEGLHFPKGTIALFPAIHSAVMLVVLFLIMPTLARFNPKKPLLLGLLASFAGYLILTLAATENYFMVVSGTVLTAFGMAIVFPIADAIVANAIVDEDRAKMMSIFFIIFFGASAPFGYLGGVLSSISERLPFVLVLGVLLVSILMVTFLDRRHLKNS